MPNGAARKSARNCSSRSRNVSSALRRASSAARRSEISSTMATKKPTLPSESRTAERVTQAHTVEPSARENRLSTRQLEIHPCTSSAFSATNCAASSGAVSSWNVRCSSCSASKPRIWQRRSLASRKRPSGAMCAIPIGARSIVARRPAALSRSSSDEGVLAGSIAREPTTHLTRWPRAGPPESCTRDCRHRRDRYPGYSDGSSSATAFE